MSPAPTPGSSDRSLSVKVYEYLRDAIIEGELAPGSRLLERELSEQLEVSRIPIRESLPQLEADGLITTYPRRGTFVTQLTLRDIGDLFDVRASLDVLAARLASERARTHPAQALTDSLDRARQATGSGTPAEIAAANAAFHDAILDLSNNRLLESLMAPISARVRWLFRLTSERDPRTLCHEHVELHAAIRSGNADLAASLAYSHVERGRAPSLASLAAVLPADRIAPLSTVVPS